MKTPHVLTLTDEQLKIIHTALRGHAAELRKICGAGYREANEKQEHEFRTTKLLIADTEI